MMIAKAFQNWNLSCLPENKNNAINYRVIQISYY